MENADTDTIGYDRMPSYANINTNHNINYNYNLNSNYKSAHADIAGRATTSAPRAERTDYRRFPGESDRTYCRAATCGPP